LFPQKSVAQSREPGALIQVSGGGVPAFQVFKIVKGNSILFETGSEFPSVARLDAVIKSGSEKKNRWILQVGFQIMIGGILREIPPRNFIVWIPVLSDP
jgi:hypothetical protein